VQFSLDQFYQLNRRILLWVVFCLLIWLLRDFFGLIFMIFALSFVAAPLSGFVRRYLRAPHFLSIILVYACFLFALGYFVRFITPRIVRQVDTFMGNSGQIEVTLLDQKRKLIAAYPSINAALMGYLQSTIPEDDLKDWEPRGGASHDSAGVGAVVATKGRDEATDDRLIRLYINRQIGRVRENVPQFVKLLWQASGTTLLALLFSFLISLDAVRLKRGVDSLRLSRLRDFYEQTAQPVVRLGYVVGRAIQVQVAIACVNTALTLTGMFVLQIHSLAALSLIVFLCSFIPVLGVFISTTPIVLVTLNSWGVGKALGVIGMVIAIHFVEAYILNPLLYGRHLKLNPALVLIVLYVSYHGFGVWGMVLGVPLTYYLLHDVLGVPLWDEPREAMPGPLAEPQTATAAGGEPKPDKAL
jgi:predicted PurR-regulated permease PerM